MPRQSETTAGAPAAARNVDVVERWIGAFDGRWPTPDQIDALATPDLEFVEHPNLVNPSGSVRRATATHAAVEAGRALLAHQRYAIAGHLLAGDDTVVTRFRWEGELAIDAGPWVAGTRLAADCCAIYRIEGDRIAHIEQFDCYEPPVPPGS
ncbi:MAG: nuclear transport factor 2 family protein [Solirubrobacteraceae bacterium]|nr:nuclear transport factor 2 family protein [Solirubrobacteraceae bacterium]